MFGVRYVYRIIYDSFISEKDEKMGIRNKIKRRAKLALKYVVDWVIDEDLSSVGVPPQQPQSEKETVHEEPVQENTSLMLLLMKQKKRRQSLQMRLHMMKPIVWWRKIDLMKNPSLN